MERSVCSCSSAGLVSNTEAQGIYISTSEAHQTLVTLICVFNFGLLAVGFKTKGKEKGGQVVCIESTVRMSLY